MDLIILNDGFVSVSSCHKADDGTYVIIGKRDRSV